MLCLFLAAFPCFVFPQQNYSFTVNTQKEECIKGKADIVVAGTDDDDQVSITWSSGQQNTPVIDGLSEGDYSVTLVIHSSADTLTTDTTLFFSIGRELCPVAVANHFTPNDDGYNDVLSIYRVEHHPDFNFEVFNRWGQRVHHQKGGQYIPWDGRSAGIAVPDGTYYYVFFYDASNKDRFVKGSITLLR